MTHAGDRVWSDQHGSEAVLKIEKVGNRLSKGLTASVTLAVDPSATPALIGRDRQRTDRHPNEQHIGKLGAPNRFRPTRPSAPGR